MAYTYDTRCTALYWYDGRQHPGYAIEVQVDTAAGYGCFERQDGAMEGGLWFDHRSDGSLELVDYDGVFELPARICDLLRQQGFIVAHEFN